MINQGIDSNGDICFAGDSNCPRVVYCIRCHRLMFPKISASGNPYFACFPGHRHLTAECHRIAENPNLIMPYLTYSYKFFYYLFKPEAGGNGEDSGDERGGGSAGGGKEARERIVPVRTLRDLVGAGFMDSPNVAIGDGWLSDIIISPRFSYMLLGNDDVGERVLVARPKYCMDKSNTIRFSLLIGYDIARKPIKKMLCLDVTTKDRETYLKLRKKLFRESEDKTSSGRTKLEPKYKNVVVAGDWSRGDMEDSWVDRGAWTCIGRLYTTLAKMSCIYAPPSERIEGKDSRVDE